MVIIKTCTENKGRVSLRFIELFVCVFLYVLLFNWLKPAFLCAYTFVLACMPLEWKYDPNNWKDESGIDNIREHFSDMAIFKEVSDGKAKLRELPWRDLVERVLAESLGAHASFQQALEASDLDTVGGLKKYLENWKLCSKHVMNVLHWKCATPTIFRNVCRPGSWLADLLATELRVRRQELRPNAKFWAISNDAYASLAKSLDISQETCNSANNVGNILEHLTWVALEEKRCIWALGVVSFLLTNAPQHSGDEASSPPLSPVCPEGQVSSETQEVNCEFAPLRSTSCSHAKIKPVLRDRIIPASRRLGRPANPVMQKPTCSRCNLPGNLRRCWECGSLECRKCSFWCTWCPQGDNKYTICHSCHSKDKYLKRRNKYVWVCSWHW